MKCLSHIDRTQLPNDIVMMYLNVYKSIGGNDMNHDTLNNDYEAIILKTIESDTYYFVKLFDIDVSNIRFKSLIFKDVKPRTKSEELVRNIRNTFLKIYRDISSFNFITNEIQDLLQFIYQGIIPKQHLSFRRTSDAAPSTNLLRPVSTSTREILEKTVSLFNQRVAEKKYEVGYLIVNFYIDFLNIKPFYDKNEEIGLLLMHILLLANGYEVFEYESFIKHIYTNKERFDQLVNMSSFNYEEGLAQVLPLHRFILQGSLEAYQELMFRVRDYEFDKHLNKTNNIENSILKLEEVFTKEDIRQKHPFVSDSTINRTLKRMRDEGLISPLGKGRSAKWMRIVESNNKDFNFEQIGLKFR